MIDFVQNYPDSSIALVIAIIATIVVIRCNPGVLQWVRLIIGSLIFVSIPLMWCGLVYLSRQYPQFLSDSGRAAEFQVGITGAFFTAIQAIIAVVVVGIKDHQK